MKTTPSKPKESPVKDIGEFTEQKIMNRKFHVCHKATGRMFEVIGAPAVHKWECWEYKLGPGNVPMNKRHVPLVDWQSKNRLLVKLHAYLTDDLQDNKTTPEPHVPYNAPLAPMPKFVMHKVKRTPLYVKDLRPNKFRYTTTDKLRTFYIETMHLGKAVPAQWFCYELGVKQKIATGLRSQEEALKELYMYLDETPVEYEQLNETLVIRTYAKDPVSKEHLVQVVYPDTGAIMTSFTETPDRLEMSVNLEAAIWSGKGYTVTHETLKAVTPMEVK